MFTKKIPIIQMSVLPKLDVPDFNVDQTPSQEYNIGQHGFPQSDITILMNSDDERVRENLAARLKDFSQDLPSSTQLSDDELIKRAMPRYYQTPSELVRFSEYLADIESQNKSVSADFDKEKDISDSEPSITTQPIQNPSVNE